MVANNTGRGRKTDKETQSPMLKIFKDIMQKEKNDPEKSKLLKQKKHEDKKRKRYTETRTKSGLRTYESSESEHRRQNEQCKDEEKVLQDSEQVSPPGPYTDKKESWFLWRGEEKKCEEKDSCSCVSVSCALKRIVSSDYAGLICLFLLFGIAVMIAFFIVFKTIPTIAVDKSDTKETHKGQKLDSESLRRKLDMLKRNERKLDYDGKDFRGFKDKGMNWRHWDNSLTHDLNMPGLSALDLSVSGLRESNVLDEYDGKICGDLSNVLDNTAVSSERLKDFYKKLIETDAQIRKLKKDFSYYNGINTMNPYHSDKIRLKRSTQFLNKHFEIVNKSARKHENWTKAYYPTISILNNKNVTNDTSRFKRFGNNTDEPTGFVVEEKKLIVEYKSKNSNPKFPKCSHSIKDSKAHENQMKHPSFKTSQKLDELLDQFLYNNLPEILAEPATSDLPSKKKEKSSHEHDKTNKIQQQGTKEGILRTAKHTDDKNTDDDKLESEKLLKMIQHTAENEIKDNFDAFDEFRDTTTPYDKFNVVLSVSTLMNPLSHKAEKRQQLTFRERMGQRKLLQVEADDDEGLAYGDLKGILADDTDADEQADEQKERKKRENDMHLGDPLKDTKYNPVNVINPNWKGPMPLYPDELNMMIQQAVIENLHQQLKIQFPNTKEIVAELDNSENTKSDTQYIEDYMHSKYKNFVKMAQAYSDYGVLDGKKDEKSDRNEPVDRTEKRVKLSSENATRKGILGKMRNAGEKLNLEMRRKYGKNLTLKNYKAIFKNKNEKTGTLSTNSQIDHKLSTFNPRSTASYVQKNYRSTDSDNNYVFPMAKFKRSLKSINDDDTYHELKLGNNTTESASVLPFNLNYVTFGTENNNSFDLQVKVIDKSLVKNSDDFDSNIVESKTDSTMSADAIRSSGEFRYIKNELEIKSKQNADRNINSADVLKVDNFIEITQSKTVNSNDTKAGIVQFLLMISKWFDDLAILSGEKNSSFTFSANTTQAPRIKDEIPLPMYDADMMDNIGHRSRVLMSFVDELNNTVAATEKNGIEDITISEDKRDKETELTTELTQSNVYATDATALTDNTNDYKVAKAEETNTNTLTGGIKTESNITKGIVKRNADGSLISWDEIYDDEYGVKTDHFELPMRDKHPLFSNNIMKKSEKWLQSRFMKIAENFKRESKEHKRPTRNADFGSDNQFEESYLNKENYESSEDGSVKTDKKSSSDLTADLKEVCRQAALAVKNTKNITVREESKESEVATSLMQQLVQLMSDLVDIEVQQKTCRKLPSDLEKFLIWLTSQEPQSAKMNVLNEENADKGADRVDDKSKEELTDLLTTPSSEKEEVHDPRSECLGTLRAVQELIQQYHDMSDEDKSKMTGVKEYLETQLDYLQKQLTTINEYNADNYQTKDYLDRKRRDINRYNQRRNRHNSKRGINSIKQRRRRKSHKFIKFGKKHTKSTIGSNDVMQITENNAQLKEFKNDRINLNNINKIDTAGRDSTITSEESIGRNNYATDNYLNVYGTVENETPEHRYKKNLRDVYYKAISDAKKFTTSKNVYKFDKQGE